MPDPTTPLTLEGALGMLIEKPADEGTTPPAKEAGAGEAAPSTEQKTENTGAAEGGETPPAESAETNAPADEGKSGDEAETGDALPSIEPPSSWNAEEKEVFKSLPRAAQEAVHRREQDRTTELRNIQNRTADAQKAVEAEVGKLKGLAERIGKHVETEVAALARDFPEIKSEADVTALATQDPARFGQFQARLMAFNASRQAEAEARQALGQKAEQQQREYLDGAKKALLEAFPAWKDTAVAQKELTELQDYAISIGVPEQAARTALDPHVYKITQKAMMYDKAQKAKADALKNTPPKVVKPGTQSSTPRQDAQSKNRQTGLDRLTKTGDIEDARGLLRV